MIFTEGNDEEALSRGAFNAYTRRNLRYSQVAPLDMFQETNTGIMLFRNKYAIEAIVLI